MPIFLLLCPHIRRALSNIAICPSVDPPGQCLGQAARAMRTADLSAQGQSAAIGEGHIVLPHDNLLLYTVCLNAVPSLVCCNFYTSQLTDFMPHHCAQHRMQPIVTDVLWCLCICLLIATVNTAKMDKPWAQIPLGMGRFGG